MAENPHGDGRGRERRTLEDYAAFTGTINFNNIARPTVNATNMKIKDKKGCVNQVADHLSRLVNEEVTTLEKKVLEEFPDEKLLLVSNRPWFAEMANFKAA